MCLTNDVNVIYYLLPTTTTTGSESRRCHLSFRYCACFEQGVPWHSGNCRVWIHSETRTWHGNNIQSKAPYRYVLTTQLKHLVSLAKWSSLRLHTKCLNSWVFVYILSSCGFESCRGLEPENNISTDWFKTNKMIVNPNKFKSIIIAKKKRNEIPQRKLSKLE